jgi:hypothetical protein
LIIGRKTVEINCRMNVNLKGNQNEGELQIKSRKFKLKSENVMERKLINENKKKCFRKIPVLRRGLTFLIQAKT